MRACRPSCKARACPGPATCHSMAIDVSNVKAAMARVGGQMPVELMDIPGMGRCVPFVDTEGQRNSMMASLV